MSDLLEPGDLLAYLDGADLPHVAQAIQDSPDLRQALDLLRENAQRFQQEFGGVPLPDPQDLVDVIAGQATERQRLRVAAYVRADPVGRRHFAALQQVYTPVPSRTRLPRFLAHPLASAAGVRAGTVSGTEQTLYAADLSARVVLRLIPPRQEIWQIEGYITQDDRPVPDVRVRLWSTTARPRPRSTDADGFFAFRRLAAGTYQLEVSLAQGRVRVQDVVLRDE